MVPVLNEPLLAIALRQLQHAGFSSFALNAHYMAEAIETFANLQKAQGVDIRVSVERPEILGTGGAFMPLRSWIGRDSFMVYNGDLLSDISFRHLQHQHHLEKNLVTMALRPGHNGKDLAVWGSPEGRSIRVHDIAKIAPDVSGIKPFTFACAYMAAPELLGFLPSQGPSFVIDGMVEGLRRGHKVTGIVHDGFWADLGTPESLFATNQTLCGSSTEIQSRILCLPAKELHPVHPDAMIAATAQLGSHTVVGKSVVIGADARVQNALLLDGSIVAAGEQLQNVICGPNHLRISIK